MNENRDFKGVWIPRHIYLDKRLSALDKMILVEIDSLDSTERRCYASNAYLAQMCQCGEATVKRTISKLEELGYIATRVYKDRGNYREIKSYMNAPLLDTPSGQNEPTSGQNEPTSGQNEPKVILENNNINITKQDLIPNSDIAQKAQTRTKKEKPQFKKPTIEELKAYCEERNNGIDPEHFWHYYETRNWTVSGRKMKNWKSAIVTWEKVEAKEQATIKPKAGTFTLKGFYGTFTFPLSYKGMSLHACLKSKRDNREKMTDTELAELEKLDAEFTKWWENYKAQEASAPLF